METARYFSVNNNMELIHKIDFINTQNDSQ